MISSLALIRADGGYSWSRDARRFRGPDGRFVSQTTIKATKNHIVNVERGKASALANNLINGSNSADQFVRLMRALVKRTSTMEYMLGRGGQNIMTQADYGRLGSMLKQEYKYINKLAQDIENGLDPDQAKRRAEMYVDNTRSAYERGQLSAWNITIDEHPPLHPNCLCSLAISQHGSGDTREIRVYWRVNSAHPCSICLDLRAKYSPLRIPDPE